MWNILMTIPLSPSTSSVVFLRACMVSTNIMESYPNTINVALGLKYTIHYNNTFLAKHASWNARSHRQAGCLVVTDKPTDNVAYRAAIAAKDMWIIKKVMSKKNNFLWKIKSLWVKWLLMKVKQAQNLCIAAQSWTKLIKVEQSWSKFSNVEQPRKLSKVEQPRKLSKDE